MKIELKEGMTVKVEDGYVVISEPDTAKGPSERFKVGDFVTLDEQWVSVYRGAGKMKGTISDFCGTHFKHDAFTDIEPTCHRHYSTIRQSSASEIVAFESLLRKSGKRWNAQKMQIVDLEWTPKRGEVVKTAMGNIYIYNFQHNLGFDMLGHICCMNGKIEECCGGTSALQTTREERGKFFEALGKAGYKWNSKKLELKKVEKKWEPKDGEFIVAKDGTISILGKKEPSGNSNVLCRLFKNGILHPCHHGTYTPGFIIRKATESECQQILGALKKAGKTWNAELKRVEDVPVKTVEMTMEQVCEKLGMNVKIMKK